MITKSFGVVKGLLKEVKGTLIGQHTSTFICKSKVDIMVKRGRGEGRERRNKKLTKSSCTAERRSYRGRL